MAYLEQMIFFALVAIRLIRKDQTKGGEYPMSFCIVCGDFAKERRDYCDECFSTSIQELDRRYSQKEGPAIASEDVDRTPVSNPGRVSLPLRRVSYS